MSNPFATVPRITASTDAEWAAYFAKISRRSEGRGDPLRGTASVIARHKRLADGQSRQRGISATPHRSDLTAANLL